MDKTAGSRILITTSTEPVANVLGFVWLLVDFLPLACAGLLAFVLGAMPMGHRSRGRIVGVGEEEEVPRPEDYESRIVTAGGGDLVRPTSVTRADPSVVGKLCRSCGERIVMTLAVVPCGACGEPCHKGCLNKDGVCARCAEYASTQR